MGESRGCVVSKSRGAQRLVEISSEIMNLISTHQVTAVAVEGYAFGARSGQAFSIGELGGVIRYCLHVNGIPFVEVAPTSRAKFATGRGNSSKSEVVSAVSARTGIVWSGPGADDMCDAWILEEMALMQQGNTRYDWPESSKSVVESIDWRLKPEDKGRTNV